MTITETVSNISSALSDIKSAITSKGVTPTGDISTYASAIRLITTGDSSDVVGVQYYDNKVKVLDDLANVLGVTSETLTINNTCFITTNSGHLVISNEFRADDTYSRLVARVYAENQEITMIEMYIKGYIAEVYSNSGGGGGEETPQAVTIDSANNTITFSSEYLTDLTGNTVSNDFVLTKSNGSYERTAGELGFQKQLWSSTDGTNTGYFYLQGSEICLGSNSSGNDFATVTYTYTSPSQETNWQTDMTITNITITAPDNWVEN